MIHVLKDRVGIEHVLMTGHAFDVRDEANTASIFLMLGIVQALGGGEVEQVLHGIFHLC
jgi:hypothetical protein